MTLRAEIVLAKATAGHPLTIGGGTDFKRIMSRPEYAMYYAGLFGPPLWLVKLMYSDDGSYSRCLVGELRVDIALNFVWHNVDSKGYDYERLARLVLLYFLNRCQCPECGGTGRSKWHVRQCGHCRGKGITPLYDKDIAEAAGIPRSTYSRKRAVFASIIERMLALLADWHTEAMAHIGKRLSSQD